GCERQTPTATTQTDNTTLIDVAPSVPAGMAGARISGIKDPDTAIRLALNGIKKGRLEQAYDFLPFSYQQEIDGLLQSFATRMDPDLWNELFAVLRKGVDVLKTKKEFVLPLVQQFALGPRGNEPHAAERLETNWD